ncbi:4'-phosphopantetheinyl transferase superfamily protein [uncultured Desulfobulbus sp.]|uniref:4'-phosphopantetheinyl transferase superfamily protein n=1 Tax=uncultured Desulfobulbus sp. TaxID=239745 RepID=UPI0029C7F210|nr:4'-phosphopantetheinyl transferase superfamily protein [uncultured Desulfobulbus sp.]
MFTECQDITVHATSFAHQGGPVFYASLPGDGETGTGCGASRAVDQKRLVTALCNHVGAMDNPRWLYRHLFDRATSPIQVAHGPLGSPQLWLGAVRGPAVSFSEGGGKIWAALCGDGSDIGIDVAADGEFQGNYPLHRVFHDQELHHAGRLTGGDLAKAAALLWSIKEAVVKALGCAFHLVAPRQVHVFPSRGGGWGYTFPVRLLGKALMRYPLGGHRSIWVRSYPLEGMWLSIALVHGQSQ